MCKGVHGCVRVRELHGGPGGAGAVPDGRRAAQSCPRRRAAGQALGMVPSRCESLCFAVNVPPGVKRVGECPAILCVRPAPTPAPAPRARGAPPQGDAQVARHRAGAVCGGGERRGGGRRAGRRHLPGPAAARAARARAARQGRRAGALALTQAARRPVPLRVGAPAGHAGAGLRVAGAHDCPAVFAPRACAAKAR